MRRLVKYEGQTFMYPNGEVADAERVYSDYPAAKVFTFVVETDQKSQVMMGMNNLSVMMGVYGISDDVTEDEAVSAIEAIMNTPQEVEEVITPEERIAAAMEYQMLISMTDEPIV